MRTMSTVAMLAVMPTLVAGHGYISKPASRAFGCRNGNGQIANRNCGPVQYEPQSVEGNDGSPRYPARASNGIPDGRIASANRPGAWGNLDEQSATRWDKVSISAGWNTFEWVFTAAHSTRDFRYWITKEGWNPNEALRRDTFEEAPFCTVALNNAAAATNPNHRCYVPARPGQYAVILGVWDVADTDQSFYNVVDVVIDGTAAPPTPVPPPTPAPPATPTPPATPVPPTPPTGCTLRGQRCYLDSGCCSPDDACVEGWPNAGWYKCVDKTTVTDGPSTSAAPQTTTTTATTTTTTTAAPVPTTTRATGAPGGACNGELVRNWGPCKGREACCQPGWYCFRQSIWYSQCTPEN